MSTVVQTLVEKSLEVDSVAEVHELCSKICDSFEFDHFLYATRFPSSLVKPFVLIVSGYPEEWRERYVESHYVRIDPTVRHCLDNITPIVWTDLLQREHPEAVVKFMQEAGEFGLRSGATMPYHGGHGEAAMLSFSSAAPPGRGSGIPFEHVSQAHLLGAYVHEAVTRLVRAGKFAFKPQALTPREKECLLWSAEGKTSWETSQILGISERTVIFHLQNAASKLQVATRQQAVARAVSQGLISPSIASFSS